MDEAPAHSFPGGKQTTTDRNQAEPSICTSSGLSGAPFPQHPSSTAPDDPDTAHTPCHHPDPETLLSSASDDTPVPDSSPRIEELLDRVTRTLAEMENLRRRTEKEVQDARSYGVSAFARDIIGVCDNFQRAMDSLPPQADAAPPIFRTFIEGIKLVEEELLKTLAKHGIKRFDSIGQRFDPNIHQAMFETKWNDAPEGTVVQVVQDGYMIHDRILRAAMVGISKGGAASGDTEA